MTLTERSSTPATVIHISLISNVGAKGMDEKRMDDAGEALPPHTIRESKRARSVTIRITPRGEVIVVVPRRYDRSRIPALLLDKKGWIEGHLERIREERGIIGPHHYDILPVQVELPAIDENWTVDYVGTGSSKVTAKEHEGRILRVSGNIHDKAACKAALKRWLYRRAREKLLPWLKDVSVELALPFAHSGLRGPRTRWASCSGRKSISVNFQLLFLPKNLVRYVFIHELCHTVHLDHGAKFWALCRKFEPECGLLNKEVRRAWRHVPLWLG